jgi:hypothetical protein
MTEWQSIESSELPTTGQRPSSDGPNIITLSCPSCGGQLRITGGTDRLACMHCGKQHLVRREAGAVSLAPILQKLSAVHSATDKTASELAIKRLKEEIARLKGAVHAQDKTCDTLVNQRQRMKANWEDAIARRRFKFRTGIVCIVFAVGLGALMVVLLVVVGGTSSPKSNALDCFVCPFFVGSLISLALFVFGLISTLSNMGDGVTFDSLRSNEEKLASIQQDIDAAEQELRDLKAELNDKKRQLELHLDNVQS